jgi:hypothetical protein
VWLGEITTEVLAPYNDESPSPSLTANSDCHVQGIEVLRFTCKASPYRSASHQQ